MTTVHVTCPRCFAEAGKPCIRVNGINRVATHRERLQAASEASGGPSAPKRRKSRVVRRFGASLRLYGPDDAPTHAVLVMAHGADRDTPRGFLAELESEELTERHGRQHHIGTEWRLHFDGRPRIKRYSP